MSQEHKGGFEELEVWKRATDYRIYLTKLSKNFPTEEKFKLTSQLIRAARSNTANIAEGYGRFHYQENVQFCRVARGSLMETLDHIICASDETYLNETQLAECREKYESILKLLNGYINYLKQKKESTN